MYGGRGSSRRPQFASTGANTIKVNREGNLVKPQGGQDNQPTVSGDIQQQPSAFQGFSADFGMGAQQQPSLFKGFNSAPQQNIGGFNQNKPVGGDAKKSGSDADNKGDEPRKEGRIGRLGGYVPMERALDEICKEDERSKVLYSTVFQNDETVLVTGLDFTPVCIESWTDTPLDANIMRNIENAGYVHPRKIQSYAVPLILDGHDLKAQAETGSGKSAAFLVPLIHKIIQDKKTIKSSGAKNKAFALIIEPTRELALQLFDQARKLAQKTDVSVVKCYGQYDLATNGAEIMKGCDIVVATPGRLVDFVEHGTIDVSQLKYFVLDEADRLISDPDFMEIIQRIRKVSTFPPQDKMQNLLFSATFPKIVENLSGQLLKPKAVFIHNERTVAANSKVDMTFIECPGNEKKIKVLDILQKDLETAKSKDPEAKQPRTLVFVQRRSDADLMALFLSESGLRATTINGDRPQRERERALQYFRSENTPILVATDVCARGLDIKDLDFVINMDLPDKIETFVHRIGRTGRLKEGRAVSLFDIGSNQALAAGLVKLLEEGKKNDVPKFLRDAASSSGSGGFGAGSGGFSQTFGASGFGANIPAGGFASFAAASNNKPATNFAGFAAIPDNKPANGFASFTAISNKKPASGFAELGQPK